MATPEKRENSVLFSLRELKQIEEKRVQEEEHAVRSAEEERQLAAQESERRRRETEESRVRQLQEQERAAAEAEAARIREDALRLSEAETRARIEAQAALDAQRLQQEMELRRHEVSKKRPTWLIAVAGVLVVGVAALIFVSIKHSKQADLDRKHNQELAAQLDQERKEKAALDEQLKGMSAQMDDLNKNIASANAALASAQTDADRQKAKDQLAALESKKNDLGNQIKQTSAKQNAAAATPPGPKKGVIKIDQKCLDNPLAPGC